MRAMCRFLSVMCMALATGPIRPAAAAEQPATPPSGTISTIGPGPTWSGGPFTGSTTDPLGADCTNSTCSVFTLTVSGTNPLTHQITVRIDWALPTNDLDLYIVDAVTGAIIQSSGEAATNFEEASFAAVPGVYKVQALIYRAVNESYTGRATLSTTAPEPPVPMRTANYQSFDFGFTSEVKLPEQERSLVFIDQDIEPEIEIDPFGTIYISAIRGVPTGADFWRSDNGGASFDYLGQPDGAQSPSPFPVPSPEGGAGGGDVDVALGDPFFIVPPAPPASPGIMSTGRIYVSSLWLGSATLSVSVDRGDNWVPNPFTTAQLDRQWNVARGEKTLYMTLRKLAQLQLGQHSVFALKSEDGATFLQGSFVQDPDEPKSIAEDVGGNVVLTTDEVLYGTFVSRDGSDLYIYRFPKTGPGPGQLPTPPQETPPLLNDPAQIFAVGRILHGTQGLTSNNTFPIITADQADNLHVAFGDRHNVYLMSCPAGADPTIASNWTNPVPMNAPGLPAFAFTTTSMFPWIKGGAPGKVAAIWYGTDVSGDADTPVFETGQAPWKIVYAQVENALAATPDIYLDVASTQGGGVVHKGQICVRGTGCPNGTRELAEYSSLTLDHDGFANIAYAGTVHNGVDPANTGAITFFTKSTLRPLKQEPPQASFDCDDPSVSSKGGWHHVQDTRATDGHYCRNVGAKKANAPAYLLFSFTGTGVDMQIARGPRGGNAEVFIDGTSQGTVDFFRPASDPAHPDNSGRRDLTFGEFVSFQTGPGSHTFRLDVLNDIPEPEGSHRDMIYVDGFVVHGGDPGGTGNPTEIASFGQGTAAPGLPGVSIPVAASGSTTDLTAVLEVPDGSNLDLALLDPQGQTVQTSQTTNATEVIRWATASPGLYTFLITNLEALPSEYSLWTVQTVQSGSPLAVEPSRPAGGELLNVSVHYATGLSGRAHLTISRSKAGPLKVQLFDLSGRLVRTLFNDASAPAGRREMPVDAATERIASALYFYRVEAGSRVASGPLVLAK